MVGWLACRFNFRPDLQIVVADFNLLIPWQGWAYQLIDDVLDFTGTSASLGKGSLSDIRHGIVTAPLLFAIEEFPDLREVVQRGFNSPADVDLFTSNAVGFIEPVCGLVSPASLSVSQGFYQRNDVAIDSGSFEISSPNIMALDYLARSEGIQRAKDLAAKHAKLAAEAIGSLAESDDEDVRRSRRALIDLTKRVITRTK
ncbi:hypothetical protein Cgig2_028039 [Carnegiea gigantea]|uniref:Uncharacterized protein n=1 Tax=Carnegiea gigantea TaxID=171969 RepID=A0A9Q1Q6E3_9CARY|nr:hypothetical protein Cgig2_028039 [Carnegiea gigantea]